MEERFIQTRDPVIEWSKLGKIRWFNAIQWLYEPAAVILVPLISLIVGGLLSLPIIAQIMLGNEMELGPLADDPNAMIERQQELIFSNPIGLAAVTIVSFGAMHLTVWLWIRIMERRSWWTIGLPFKAIGGVSTALFQYGRGLLIGLGLQLAIVGMLALLGMLDFETPFRGVSTIVLRNIGLLFVAFVIQGAAEEVLTRGLIFQVVGRRYGVWVGVLISALIFGLLHLGNPNTSSIAIANLFLAGLLFSLYALNEGTIWGACALHSIWNWTMGNLLGLEVSGIEFAADTAALLDLQETGPDHITGGAFGPEGGLVVTSALVLVCGFLLFTYWRKGTLNA